MKALRSLGAVAALLFLQYASRAETFRVVTYNVENYLDAPLAKRVAKSAEAKAKICDNILALRPDVLALQEIGAPSALDELQAALKAKGLDLANSEFVCGPDPAIHVAILSRFAFTARHSYTNESFLLGGRRLHVSRGFGEVEIQVTPNYSFTLMTAHLKSRRPVPQGDESEIRLEEAKLFRQKIDAVLATKPDSNLIVLGDFNDTKDSESTKAIIGSRGKTRLIDARPAERNGDPAVSAIEQRNITWTHYYGVEDSYSRIDYILLSPGMAQEWLRSETYVLSVANWGTASDHRPLVATFDTGK